MKFKLGDVAHHKNYGETILILSSTNIYNRAWVFAVSLTGPKHHKVTIFKPGHEKGTTFTFAGDSVYASELTNIQDM
jgi:hypothetical protein